MNGTFLEYLVQQTLRGAFFNTSGLRCKRLKVTIDESSPNLLERVSLLESFFFPFIVLNIALNYSPGDGDLSLFLVIPGRGGIG